MRPRRPALPLMEVEREEKTSFYILEVRISICTNCVKVGKRKDWGRRGGGANTAVDDILTAGVVIDVDRHAAEG